MNSINSINSTKNRVSNAQDLVSLTRCPGHETECRSPKDTDKSAKTQPPKRESDDFGYLGDGLAWLGRKADWHVRLGGAQYILTWGSRKSSLFTCLHKMPSAEWMASIASPNKNLRIQSYWLYRNESEQPHGKPVVLPTEDTWQQMHTDLVRSSRSPTALIAMRAAIYRILGDVTDSGEALDLVRSRLEILDVAKQTRRYIGPILADRHGANTCSGHEYEYEKILVIGVIHRVRAVYEAMELCLSTEEIAFNLFEVPGTYYEREFCNEVKKRVPALQKNTVADNLFATFRRREANAALASESSAEVRSDEYELIGMSNKIKKY